VGRAGAGAGGAARTTGTTGTTGAVRAGHAGTAGTARRGMGRMRGARALTTGRTIALARAGRAAATLRRPVAGRRLVRRLVRLLMRGRSLPMGAGRHGVGNGSGAGAGPISAGSATDAVGVGAEAGIGRRLATHPAKLPF
jgi:hypothetical protein